MNTEERNKEMDDAFKEFHNQPLKFAARPKEITIEQLFPTGDYLNIRVGMVWSVGDENPFEVMEAAMDIANNFHRTKFPQLYDKEGKPKFYPQVVDYQGEEPLPEIQQQPKETKLTGFAHWENEINKCTTIEKPEGIESLRMIAMSNPKLMEVFNNKLEQLKNNQ